MNILLYQYITRTVATGIELTGSQTPARCHDVTARLLPHLATSLAQNPTTD